MGTTPPTCATGWIAPEFTLPATDSRTIALSDIAGPRGTLIMFICNHCPYVLAVIDRVCRDARDLKALGVGVAAICSNDAVSHPDDSFDNMIRFAQRHGLPFAYLHDADQSVARAYDAACPPDFFGFNEAGVLHYRGRLDASRKQVGAPDLRRDFFEAMRQIAETGVGPAEQIPSIGCSIKWKAA